MHAAASQVVVQTTVQTSPSRSDESAFPPSQAARASAAVAGTKSRSLLAVRAPSETPELWSVTSLRATPFKVGGRVPKVWFKSDSEPKPFGVTATEKEAREVAHHLYDEVEVTFRFVRDEDGAISDGLLEAFRPVTPLPDELASWRAWFREVGAHLVDVDDVDAALSRDPEE